MRKAVRIQANYRRHLAQNHRLAVIRDRAMKERFYAARRQRGFLLRRLGFKNRRTQAQLGFFLRFLGIDPITFHYRIREVMGEIKNDFVSFAKVCRREMYLYHKYRGVAIPMTRERRQLIIQQRFHFQVSDAVRIIEPGHKFQGYTGVIVRMDTSLPGIPLYEVKLDRFLFKQTYVKMSTDGSFFLFLRQVLH